MAPSGNSLTVARCPSVQSPVGYVGVNNLSLLIPESPLCHTLTLLAQEGSFQVSCVNTEILSGEQTPCHLIYQSAVILTVLDGSRLHWVGGADYS